MKTLLMLLMLLCLSAKGSTNTVFIGALVSVNGTNTSGSLVTGTFPLPGGVFYVENGGLSTTQAFAANVQWCTDNSNWVTVATYNPSVTNAGVYQYTMPTVTRTNYFRVQTVTTNAVNTRLTFTQ